MSLVPLAFSVTHKTSATFLIPCFTVTNTVGQWPLHFSFFAAFYMGHLNSKAFFLTSLLMKINNFQSSGSLPIYITIWNLDQHYEQEVHQHLHHQGNTQAQCQAAEEDKMFFCCKTKQNLMNWVKCIESYIYTKDLKQKKLFLIGLKYFREYI